MLNCHSFRFVTLLPVSQEGMEARSSLHSKQKLELPASQYMVDGQLVMQGQRFLLSPRLKVPVRQENILDLCFHFSAVKEDRTFRSIAGIVRSKRQVRKEKRRGWVRHCAGCKRRH